MVRRFGFLNSNTSPRTMAGRWLTAVCLAGLLSRPAHDGRAAVPLVAPPREVVELLTSAEQAVRAKRYSEAIGAIGRLRQAAALDAFLETEADGVQHTLRFRLEKLIASLPAEGAVQFETWFGGEARRRLEEAIAGADRKELAETARRNWGTRAGYDAIMLAGCVALDRGEAGQALAWWRWLDQWPGAAARYEPQRTLKMAVAWLLLDRPEQARRWLDRLKQFDDVAIRLGDDVFTRDEGDKIFALLARSAPGDLKFADGIAMSWPWPRGDAAWSLSGAAKGGALPLAWRAEAGEAGLSSEATGQPPAPQPLMVHDFVFCRMPERLIALELQSGRQRWQYGGSAGPASIVRKRLQQGPVARPISTDGERLFLVEDSTRGRAGRVLHTASVQPNHHRLSALSIAGEGKLYWSTEMPGVADDPRLAGPIFLGAPLPLEGRLYVLAEIRGDIVLCVMDARYGRLLWQAPIATPLQPVSADPLRRGVTVSPAIGEGVLVCPTATGAVAAVDPYSQRTLWAGRYSGEPQDASGETKLDDAPSTWQEVAPGIRDGHVVLPVLGTPHLLCLDLYSGRVVWRVRCNQGIYLAGIYKQTALVIGSEVVQAWDLKSGKPAWDHGALPLPDPMRPAGRGFLAGRYYYLPTTRSGIVQIDVERGVIAGEIELDGPLGNIVATSGHVVSVSPSAITAFAVPVTPRSP